MWLPSRPDRRTLGTLVILSALATSACVAGKGPGVAVRDLEADIVFGVKDDKKEEDDSPLASGEDLVPEAVVADPRARDDFLPDQDFGEIGGGQTSKPRGPSLRPVNTCPPAAANAFAEVAAPLNVDAPPKVGSYRFKKGGEQEFTRIPGQKFPITGFEQRLITDAAQVPNSPDNRAGKEFVYKVTQPDGSDGGRAVTTYRVKTGATNATVTPAASDFRARSGVPGRGVAIEKVEKFDKAGGRRGEFAPSTPLLIFPLEVVQGESFSSSAVDPRTGDSVQLQVQVKDRVEVDACGEILSGWLVEGTRSVSGGGGPQPYRYVVAPQFGGIVIEEHLNERTAEGFFSRKFTIGQDEPDPLPEGGK